MQRRFPLARRSPIRRISVRRASELGVYRLRHALFLEAHPFCQLFLAEHGIEERLVIAQNGFVRLPGGRLIRVPRASMVHHRNKRRGSRLLDESEWIAVSFSGHERIERRKRWARRTGFLRNF